MYCIYLSLVCTHVGLPPENSIIRAMAVYNTPDLLGEVVQCCPRHIEENKMKCEPIDTTLLTVYYCWKIIISIILPANHPCHFVCGLKVNEACYEKMLSLACCL